MLVLGLNMRVRSSLRTSLSFLVASLLSNSRLGPEVRAEMRTESARPDPNPGFCRICCSLLTSSSSAWKLMLRSATMLLTVSHLLSTWSTRDLAVMQEVDWSSGAIRDILHMVKLLLLSLASPGPT